MDEELEVAAWRFAVGELPSEHLADLASSALGRGVDSASLRQLAGLPAGEVREAADLFRVVLDELNVPVLGEEEALWNLVRLTARRILAGETSPIEGARWIWREASDRVQEEGDLRVFVALASEWDDHPEQRAVIEQQILQEAVGLLDRHAPRRWIQLRATHGLPLQVRRPTTGAVPVEPNSLAISALLVSDLTAWAADYNNADNGFDSETDAVEFVDRGSDLVARLQSELGEAWHVEYWPEPTRPPGLRLRPRS